MLRWLRIGLLTAAISAHAVPTTELLALDRLQPHTSLNRLRELAQAGNVDAMAFLGWKLRFGERASQNHPEGLHWLEAAVKLGSAKAHALLGVVLVESEAQDPDQLHRGLELMEAGAQAGDVVGQLTWGECLQFGCGGRAVDLRAALPWFQRAAESGLPEAHWRLAKILQTLEEEGADDAARPEDIAKHLLFAAQGGVKQAAARLAGRYERGEGLPVNLVEAARWYRVAAESGDAQSQFKLGHMLQQGSGVATNAASALIWYEQAALKGHEIAMLALALTHEKSAEAAQRPTARRWYLAAAERGNALAMLGVARVATAYDSPDAEACREALHWLERAAQAGEADAYADLGRFYLSGTCALIDKPKAMTLLGKGAEQDSTQAMFGLAAHLSRSDDPEDLRQARQWAERCAKADDWDCASHWAAMQFGGIGAKPDPQAAVDTLRPWALKGRLEAQAEIGSILLEMGDFKGALEWLERAVAQGDADSLSRLAWMTLKGHGKPRSESKGLALLTQAIGMGSQQALRLAQRRACQGLTTGAATSQCLTDLQERAQQEDADAQEQLGRAHQYGASGTPNLDQAFKLYTAAARQGHAGAQVRLALCYYQGDGTPPDAKQTSFWARKSAAQGNAEAQTVLGYLYEQGEGGHAQDDAQMLHWYRLAVAAKHPTALNNLGYAYEQGRGVPQDYKRARALYSEGFALGEESAGNNLSILLEEGKGGAVDAQGALQVLRQNAEAGNRWARTRLGRWLTEGRHGFKDRAEARRWLEPTAESGYADAMVAFSELLQDSAPDQALSWLRKAAQKGNKTAQARLKALN